MSKYKISSGKIKPANLSEEEIVNKIKRGFFSLERVMRDYDSIEECLAGEYFEEYILINNCLYEILEVKEEIIDKNLIELSENEDGSISFNATYSIGPSCLQSSLEEGVKKLNKA